MTKASNIFQVDVHTHPIPDFYKEALVAAGYNATSTGDVFVDGFRTPNFTIDSYLQERIADAYNYSILSITAPGVSFLKGNYQAASLARRLNDQMSTWAKEYPQQLGAFGILPLPDTEASLAEIKYCLDELHFEGIGLYTNVNGAYLGDPSLDPIMEELDRRGATAFVHPAGPPQSPALPGMSLPVIEYTFDTTRAIANLLFTQTRRRYPNINLIFSHGGGALPFLADRLAVQTTLPFQGGRNFNESYAELQTYYYDTAVTLGNPQFAALKEFVGADRLLTGSDYPYVPGPLVPWIQGRFAKYDGFTDQDREKIGWRNAFKLFPGLAKKFPELDSGPA
ncbi:2-amino-3-carboxymuconate-6-semialdehyde decarboxylase [Cyphellophora attinorum]|uniref:6-methylsalicylate decarboxylase n=1 Tax=Cyphellophora attinorum TaxID=1664694 RepID=A0A0N0NSB3_9EURO|nr:2-amino-3-carboxymuconate-6-semialdehyde decarboxylase [Phialophora attinorum]KPI46058.1 2-amino-3-carboxymuconate-6-semialdehyde decarboxylase [Phialophora attinorum]